MKKQLPGWAVLLIITLVAGLALGGTYALTKDPIEEQALLMAENARKEVLPSADRFEELTLEDGASLDWAYAGLKGEDTVGYVVQTTEKGFGGKIEITIGTDTNGVVSGLRIGGSDFSETPGLGANAKNPSFYEQFAGKEYPLELKKNGGEIDAITSASITSSAVVRGANSAVKAIAELTGIQLNEPVVLVEDLGDGRYATQGKGVNGAFDVLVTVDDQAVTAVEIGQTSSDMDVPYLSKIKDNSEFLNQFAGTAGQLSAKEIDLVSGATISSRAVVDAVNQAYAVSQGIEIKAPEIIDVSIPDGSETYTVQAKGLTGTFDVTIGVDETGAINGIVLGDSSSEQDTPFLNFAKNDNAFLVQFIGANELLNAEEIDLASGATISSKAVVDAVNQAYAASKGEVIEQPAKEEVTLPEKPADGVFSAAEQGFAGPVYVEAAFDGEGKISYISVGDDSFAETAGFGANALLPENQAVFIGKQMPLELGDVDALTGATFTKTAIVNGLNKAYAASKGEVIEEPAKEEVTLPEKPADGVFSAAEQGFAGPVYVEAAFDGEGKISYISVGDDSFAETAGFGANALLPENQAAFIGKQMPLELGDVDVLTGATFTKTAIVNGLNKAYAASKGEVAEEPKQETKTVEEKPAVTYSADAFGFQSDVYVEAAFEDGKVSWISIGDKRFEETPGLGAKALDPEFQAQFIGKSVPLEVSDIDGITGATFTTKAVVDALNKAYAKFQSAAEVTAEPAAEAKPEGVVTASAQGFGGPVAVEAAFEDGKISYIAIGDDQFAETPSLGAKALEEAFQAQFIGKQMPLTLSDIDAIAGATITSTAVVDALNEAYQQAAPAKETKEEETASAGIIGGADGPTVIVLPTVMNGEAVGEAISFFTAIQAKVEIENGVLTGLELLDKPVGAEAYAPSAREEAMKAKFIGSSLPLSTKLDTAYASAVAVAINQAFGTPGREAESGTRKGNGSCIMFFTRYNVAAGFEDDALTEFSVLTEPVGTGAPVLGTGHLDDPALTEALIGQIMPLNPADYSGIGGVPEYAVRAVVIAINQAYENPVSDDLK